MPKKLTWDDLLIQNLAGLDAGTWLGYWSGWVAGKAAPVFMSKFGDWFLRRPDGSTDELSVVEGTYTNLAATPDDFIALVNTPQWQEQHLLSQVVAQLHERNIILQTGQCYGFAPHPRFSGHIDLAQVMVMDIGVWQYICVQTVGTQRPGGRQPRSVGTMKLFCPKCGDQLTQGADGHLSCIRGQMPLTKELEERLIECYATESRRPHDTAFVYKGRPHRIGGQWFCPGCGVRAEESTPGDLRCPKCARSLVEFAYSLIERHPHFNEQGKWA